MKSLKIEILNEQHSKDVQECLFTMGYSWKSKPENEIKHTKYKYLIVHASAGISCVNSKDAFESCNYDEIFLDEIESGEIGGQKIYYFKSYTRKEWNMRMMMEDLSSGQERIIAYDRIEKSTGIIRDDLSESEFLSKVADYLESLKIEDPIEDIIREDFEDAIEPGCCGEKCSECTNAIYSWISDDGCHSMEFDKDNRILKVYDDLYNKLFEADLKDDTLSLEILQMALKNVGLELTHCMLNKFEDLKIEIEHWNAENDQFIANFNGEILTIESKVNSEPSGVNMDIFSSTKDEMWFLISTTFGIDLPDCIVEAYNEKDKVKASY